MARFYKDWVTAYDEIKRDLSENGITIKTKSMQNKIIDGNPLYVTREIQNYSYVLLDAKSSEITNVSQPWADAEFEERISKEDLNPGVAYKLRNEVWEEFLVDGKMSYTYNERYNRNNQLEKLISDFKNDPNSRQGWLSVWDPNEDVDKLGGKGRVPCTLGYHFQYRNGKLNMHNVMRSCDLYTHFCNDVYLGIKLLEYVAKRLDMKVGNYQQTIFSLHTYKKNIEKEIF